jgi:hypothetical protein
MDVVGLEGYNNDDSAMPAHQCGKRQTHLHTRRVPGTTLFRPADEVAHPS